MGRKYGGICEPGEFGVPSQETQDGWNRRGNRLYRIRGQIAKLLGGTIPRKRRSCVGWQFGRSMSSKVDQLTVLIHQLKSQDDEQTTNGKVQYTFYAKIINADNNEVTLADWDTTVRFWDVNTNLPKFTGREHKNHVLCTAWSPDGKLFVPPISRACWSCGIPSQANQCQACITSLP